MGPSEVVESSVSPASFCHFEAAAKVRSYACLPVSGFFPVPVAEDFAVGCGGGIGTEAST